MIAASYEPRQQKEFKHFIDELDPGHSAEVRYAALFQVAHSITKATEAGGTGKHAATFEACEQLPVVQLLVGVYEDYAGDEQIPPFILSTLVNISCMNPQLIIDGGGFELLLHHIHLPKRAPEETDERAVDEKNQYYALAGVYNLSEDKGCAQEIVGRGLDKTLEQLAKSPDEETSRHATFTLKNLQHVRGAASPPATRSPVGQTQEYVEDQMRKIAAMFPKLATAT